MITASSIFVNPLSDFVRNEFITLRFRLLPALEEPDVSCSRITHYESRITRYATRIRRSCDIPAHLPPAENLLTDRLPVGKVRSTFEGIQDGGGVNPIVLSQAFLTYG